MATTTDQNDNNNNNKSIVLIDASIDSLLISWPEIPGVQHYELQYRTSNNNDDNNNESIVLFETLSDKLTSTQVRKRNLKDIDNNGFMFRVKDASSSSDEDAGWISHTEPFHLLSSEGSNRMETPQVYLGGSNASLRITWKEVTDAKFYELQMRENISGIPWKTITSTLQGIQVRKKNLISQYGYQFRIKPIFVNDDNETTSYYYFSEPSDVVMAIGFSDGLKRLFGNTNIGGKEFILLYASAHWCGPCRQYTPQLVQWYNTNKISGSTVQVVFLSADHDETSFQKYFQSMPWLSIDYNDNTRENLMTYIRVTGIPRLAVLDGRTGRIIEDNAVGKQLDINRWRKLI